VVGAAGAVAFHREELPKRFWFFSIVLPVLPDADSIGFGLGVPYGHFLGHRGFFHSLFFGLILALLVVAVFFRDRRLFSKNGVLLVGYFFVLAGSHGVLDALTNGGLGVALFSPFDNVRYFFPWRPVQVSPIGIKAFFSSWGGKVLLSEILWVWMPWLVLAILIRLTVGARMLKKGKRDIEQREKE
jgi:inner membrane protein